MRNQHSESNYKLTYYYLTHNLLINRQFILEYHFPIEWTLFEMNAYILVYSKLLHRWISAVLLSLHISWCKNVIKCNCLPATHSENYFLALLRYVHKKFNLDIN